MSSWRAAAGEHVERDFDELTSAALHFARHGLGKFGEIHPFAIHRMTDGDTVLSMPTSSDTGEYPQPTDVLDWLVLEAQQSAQHLRAIAIVADLRLEDGTAPSECSSSTATGTPSTSSLATADRASGVRPSSNPSPHHQAQERCGRLIGSGGLP